MFFQGLNFVFLLLIVLVLRFPCCGIRNLTQFYIACKTCPSSRYVAAANLVCSIAEIFTRPIRYLIQILPQEHVSLVLGFNYTANFNINFLSRDIHVFMNKIRLC
jgi:hypothetical protein